ncbi:unnamed protein product [Paramecium pentaurelia]|uniref:Tetratricopeptide repeat protein n=1 Tax=Paramecium pentaurelia TaxID=43138 RepID=A0A8S1XBF8_9CILI|nr:unnamed protein product [Paramecium pentaurelia]
MSTGYERIDQETLRRDDQLNGLLQRIREDVMNGYVVEVKTRANSYNQLESNSKQSSRLSSMCNSIVKQPIIQQNEQHKDLEEIAITSQRDQQYMPNHSKILGNSPPKVKSVILKPVVLNQELSPQQTYQQISIKEEPKPTKTISQQLDEIETNADTGDCQNYIKILKTINSQLQQSMNESVQDCNHLFSQAIQTVRTKCLLTRFYKQVGDFKNAIKQLKAIQKQFKILEPNLVGKILIELGKLHFLNQAYQNAQSSYYMALQHYEKLEWKSEIAHILLLMAKLHAWTKNFELSKKLTYGAIAILKEFLPDDHESIAEAYIVLGECNYISKNSDEAIEFLMKAVKIKYQIYKDYKHLKFVEVFNLLGLTYGLIPDIQQSLNYFIQALQCFQQNCVQRAQILNNISVIYQAQGDVDKASKCHFKAKEIYSTFLPNQHSQMQRLILNQTCTSPPM